MTDISVYIHWPFCKSKCPYCDFNSHVREKIDDNSWLDAYLKEISYYKDYLKEKKIKSIFFGGGTPSLMDPKIVERIIDKLEVDKSIEITLEANPTSIESSKFKDFKLAGINRASLGIQALNDQDLKFLGREHNTSSAKKAIQIAGNIFDNYSFDLIYARPNQTLLSWKEELLEAIKMAPFHISLYQLTIEKGTKFYSLYQKKAFTLPDEELSTNLYDLTLDITAQNGLDRYEISNFAKKGYESLHNLGYWRYNDYLGIGPGAHSRITVNDRKIAIMDIHNPENWLESIDKYQHGIQSKNELILEDIIHEFIIMSLRIKEGLSKNRLKLLTGKDFSDIITQNKIDQLVAEGLVINSTEEFVLTNKGYLLLNQIITFLLK